MTEVALSTVRVFWWYVVPGRSPPDVDAVGVQVVIGARVAGLLQVPVEEHPDVHAAAGVRGQVRFRGGIG